MSKFRIFQYALLALLLGPLAGVTVYGTGKAIAQAVNSTGVSTSSSGATKVTINSPPNDVVSGPTNLTGTGNVSVSAQGAGSVGIIVTGTGSGLTFTFQGSVDGTNYVTIPCVVPSTGAIATGGTANGTWTCQAAGYQNVRVNLSAISGGTFTATLNASAGSNQPPIGTQGTSTNITAVGGTATTSAGLPVGQLPYPIGSTPYTASATGTTAATTATLAGASSVTTYICGFSIRANATAAATGNATVTGTITGTLNFTQWTAPLASGLGIAEMIFMPCVPASTTNTSIAVVSAAPGSGGVVSVTAWGYKL